MSGEPVTPSRLRDLAPGQWRAGIAAWLGWLFDGMDGYLYVLVATPFVTELLRADGPSDPRVVPTMSVIQAAFLLGWAAGGILFGRLGDRLGRSRTLALTILMYSVCTGLSALAQTWWHLLIFRFLAALGIGGEWAAGAALVAETWPRRWRPWTSAALHSAYALGMMLASACLYLLPSNPRSVFLVGALPALLVFWVRRAVPESPEWMSARARDPHANPGLTDLFRRPVRRTTLVAALLCALVTTIVWSLMFWMPQLLRNLPDVASWSPSARDRYLSQVTLTNSLLSIPGTFLGAPLARAFGHRRAMALLLLGALLATIGAYGVPRDHESIRWWVPWPSFFYAGVYGLLPMYLPPLFPTLLRTTGAGFCYNVGRVVAAAGTLVFGMYVRALDYRVALLGVGGLFVPAIVSALLLPRVEDR